MRIAVVGAYLFGSLILASLALGLLPSAGVAQRVAPAAPSGGLITLAATANDHQQLAVIEPETRSMAVYHIDLASGEVTLKSVRNLHYDLKIDVFNGTSPSPRDIRSMLEPR